MGSLVEELRGDYDALYARQDGSRMRRRLKLALRTLTNPSLHAVILLRLANRSPRPTHWLFRQILISKHGMDWVGPFTAGPGLVLPHPVGIVLSPGLQLGRNVLLSHNVSIGGDASNRAPILGDHVAVYPGAVIIGGLTIGERSIIGANSFVNRDVPAHSVYKRDHVEPLRDSAFARSRAG